MARTTGARGPIVPARRDRKPPAGATRSCSAGRAGASGGSEAIDTAAKLARRYWDVVRRPEKRIIVSREHSNHGMAAFGTSLAGIPPNKAGYGPLVDDVHNVGAHDLADLARLFAQRSGEIAAFVAEPVVGAGGVIPPKDGYFAGVAELCAQHDVLLDADEC